MTTKLVVRQFWLNTTTSTVCSRLLVDHWAVPRPIECGPQWHCVRTERQRLHFPAPTDLMQWRRREPAKAPTSGRMFVGYKYLLSAKLCAARWSPHTAHCVLWGLHRLAVCQTQCVGELWQTLPPAQSFADSGATTHKIVYSGDFLCAKL